MKEELQKLIEQYGADAVAKAATEALNKHVPTINTPVVTDEQLINTVSQLDAAVTDILETGRKNEETYQNKVELVRRARQLETSIQITEAEAINTICGTGKDAYGIIPYSDGTSLRIKRRLKAAAKQYVAGNLTYERYNSTLQSYMGMMKHNDCYRFKMQLLEDVETIINESGVAA